MAALEARDCVAFHLRLFRRRSPTQPPGGRLPTCHFFTPFNLTPAMYLTIKTQTLSMIAELTANPKPTYNVDGQSVQWSDYLKQLRATIEWCDQQIAQSEPGVEEITVCR